MTRPIGGRPFGGEHTSTSVSMHAGLLIRLREVCRFRNVTVSGYIATLVERAILDDERAIRFKRAAQVHAKHKKEQR